ncbi:MAG: N-acetylglucosamine-6-phosphate deacetylase [Candidatus Bipolaricaulota bacterium]
MSQFNLVNSTVLFPEKGTSKQKDVKVVNGTINEIGDCSNFDTRGEMIDLRGDFLSPGFVDLQVNGAAGVDFLTGEIEAIEKASRFLQAQGTTSFLGTITTQTPKTMNAAANKLSRSKAKNLLGIHIEGPFLSNIEKGAHNPAHLLSPDRETFEEVTKGCEEDIKYFTFAPELEGSKDLLEWVLSIQTSPSIGHTSASYDKVKEFLSLGVKSFTHLFNCMKGFHHRKPGPVGAALNTDAYVGVIADGKHLHPATLQLIKNIKDSERVYLVTDSIATAGMDEGEYLLGDKKISIKHGLARLEDGTIAGSTLTLIDAVKNYVKFTGASLIDAVKAVTVNPAKLLGVEDQIGTMDIGSKADLIAFDRKFQVQFTMIDGEIVYRGEGENGE